MREDIRILQCMIDDNGLYGEVMSDRQINALYKAIGVMEERVPKRPTDTRGVSGLVIGRCPRCNNVVNNVQNGCPRCMGALKWGDKE